MSKIISVAVALLFLTSCNASDGETFLEFETNIKSVECVIVMQADKNKKNIELKISNFSESVFFVSPDNFPLNGGLSKEIFSIKRDGKKIVYNGKVEKRQAYKKEELIKILPGESKMARIPLNEFYDLKKSGKYSIVYYSINIQPEGIINMPKIVKLKSNYLNVNL